MEMKADLHIHSVLSPCGSLDMSPKNLVERIKDENIDVISITDHNSISNTIAYEKVCEREGIDFIYGIEVQTEEEIHVLCYFDKYKNLKEFSDIIYKNLIKVKNNSDFFGDQVIVDEEGNILGFEENLLLSSVKLSVRKIVNLVREKRGIPIPAHIDSSFSVISQLGFIPKNLNVKFLEISYTSSKDEILKKNPSLKDYVLVSFSDAHYLNEIGRSFTIFEFDEKRGSLLRTLFSSKRIRIGRREDG